MHNITTIVFDLGRVLVRIDTSGERFGRLMRAMNIPPEQAFDKYWHAREVQQLMTGELSAADFHRIACERFDLDIAFDDFAACWSDLFHPMPGMRELFLRLSERYRVGILSDTDPLHWAAIRDMMPWLDAVGTPTLSYEVGFLKPHPNMFSAAAANAGCEKEQCLFIDDLIDNVDGARYFGMPALLFHDARRLEKDLTGVGLL